MLHQQRMVVKNLKLTMKLRNVATIVRPLNCRFWISSDVDRDHCLGLVSVDEEGVTGVEDDDGTEGCGTNSLTRVQCFKIIFIPPTPSEVERNTSFETFQDRLML